MDAEQLRKVWSHFCEGNDFILNPDKAHVDTIIDGVLLNEKKFGLKLCPCRLRDGTREKDIELICPCNFKTHSTWLKPVEGRGAMCWCGLFVKK
jgi:ferredoxin-thioredoxin reductase catalytic chain